jgi:hypothetical protein
MISAADIVRSIASRMQRAELGCLDRLSQREHQRLADTIAALPPNARVDIDKLVAEVRQQTAARPRAEPWKFWLGSIATAEQKAAFEAAVARGDDPTAAMRQAMENLILSQLDGIAQRLSHAGVEPDEEMDDAPTPKRRRIPRRSRRRSLVGAPQSAEATPEDRDEERASGCERPKPPPEPYVESPRRTWSAGGPVIEDFGFRHPL